MMMKMVMMGKNRTIKATGAAVRTVVNMTKITAIEPLSNSCAPIIPSFLRKSTRACNIRMCQYFHQSLFLSSSRMISSSLSNHKRNNNSTNTNTNNNNNNNNSNNNKYHKYIKELPSRYLRNNDNNNFDSNTGQRCDIPFNDKDGRMLLPIVSNKKDEKMTEEDEEDEAKYIIQNVSDYHHNTHDHKIMSNKNDNNSNNQNQNTQQIKIEWSDGHSSIFNTDFIYNSYLRMIGHNSRSSASEDVENEEINAIEEDNIESLCRIPWTNLTEDIIRHNTLSSATSSVSKSSSKSSLQHTMSMTFDQLIHNDTTIINNNANTSNTSPTTATTINKAVATLYRYGFLLVSNTPVDDGGVAVSAIASTLSGGTIKNDVNTSLLANYRHNCDININSKNDSNNSNHNINRNSEHNNNGPISLPNGTDGPQRTLYGTIWSTSTSNSNDNNHTIPTDGSSTSDSAYGNGALPLHTDLTYHLTPPGLQIFAMVHPAAVTVGGGGGGETILADGLAIAERLRIMHPQAFHILCSTKRYYRCLDSTTGWYLEGCGPVIDAFDRWNGNSCGESRTYGKSNDGGGSDTLSSLESKLRWGAVQSIRHNDLDRLVDLPPLSLLSNKNDSNGKVERNFYEQLEYAHSKWNELSNQDEFRLVFQMNRGDCLVVANQVCLIIIILF